MGRAERDGDARSGRRRHLTAVSSSTRRSDPTGRPEPVVAPEILTELAVRTDVVSAMLDRAEAGRRGEGPYGSVPTALVDLVPRAALAVLTPAVDALRRELAVPAW